MKLISSRIGRAVLALSALCVVSATAAASGQYLQINNGSNLYFDNTYGSAGGGEFVVKSLPTGGPSGGSGVNNTIHNNNVELFRTFCVEENQNISIPSTVHVVGLGFNGDQNKAGANLALVDGMRLAINLAVGNNAAGAVNALTVGAAALYKSYALGYDSGALTSVLGVAYSSANNTDENILQQAIWYFQGQNTFYGTGPASATNAYNNNKYVKAVTDLITANGVASLNIAGVSIMNLANGTLAANGHTLVQSQLYWDGTGRSTNPVPEPASVALWLSVVGVGALVRRRRSMVC